MLPLILALSAKNPISQVPQIEFNYSPAQGLTVVSGGIEVIKGSYFQVYAPEWTKGYFSSRWSQPKVQKIDADTIQISFQGADSKLNGNATFRREGGSKLVVDYTILWRSAEPALIELCAGVLWQAPYSKGTYSVDGATPTSLTASQPTGGIAQRSFGTGQTHQANSSAIQATLQSTNPLLSFDARNYGQEWAEKFPAIWQGYTALPLNQGTPTSAHFEYTFTPTKRETKGSTTLSLPPVSEDTQYPDTEMPVLIPHPKVSLLDWKNTTQITGAWNFPAGRPKFFDLFLQKLAQRFELPTALSGPKVSIDGGMSDLQKRPGGYRLEIKPDSISFFGEREEGLKNALYRLVQLAFIRNGKVVLPTGIIDDEPRSDFRGVHLFVGPLALDFQKKLWENVLLPLGMNKVVLQCERTEWKSLPKTRDEMTMRQEDLVALFGWYRKQNVEPIPLIQSFGHMEWFFARGANLDLAYNRELPYAIDPRKAEARALVGKLWDEAVTALKPSIVHFGLDEVDMRGFEKKDPQLVTDLWRIMLPALGEIAKRNKTTMMLWGDKALAPSEAVDAALGDDLKHAQARRDVIPKGAMIADWHYKADQNYKPFLKSLQIWKLNDLIPIASTWFRPENIRGFGVAADIEGAGTLQTTWAGYESNEANMLKAIPQFEAMVLSADYGWSGRTEMLNELPYRADEVFAKMYNPKPSVLSITKGKVLGSGQEIVIGFTKFRLIESGQLAGIMSDDFDAPSSLTVPLNASTREIYVALGCSAQVGNADKIGAIEVSYVDGTKDSFPLNYGLHVRSAADKASTFFGPRSQGISAIRLVPKPKKIVNLKVIETDLTAGLQLKGITYR